MSDALCARVYRIDMQLREFTGSLAAPEPWYVPDAGLLPTTAEGFVVCAGTPEDPVVAFDAFPYTGRTGTLRVPVLRAGRVLAIHGGWGRKEVGYLLAGLHRLARYVHALQVELEAYRQVCGPIFFPSSSSNIDVCNDPELCRLLATEGIPAVDVSVTYQLPIDEPIARNTPSHLVVRPARPGTQQDRETYYRLWKQGRGLRVGGAPPAGPLTDLRPWYGDACLLLDRPEYIFIAEQRGTPIGFIHWSPNWYRMAASGGRAVTLALSAMEGTLQVARRIGEAKIFKLVVSHRAGRDVVAVAEALLTAVLRVMRLQFGVRLCQVSGVRQGDATVKSFLKGLGFTPVHEMATYSFPA
ncbi:MAG: hypothetical protein AB1609_08340 [Bacillota bacterium]